MIFVRCDVSATIGWGHIKRCLTLSQSLKKYTAVTFLMSGFNSKVEKIIKDSGCAILKLPTGLSYQDEIKHYPNYCKEIIIDLGHRANNRDPDPFTRYLTDLKKLSFKIIVIDGLGDESYRAKDAPKIAAYIQPYWGVPLDPAPKSDKWFYGKECVLVDHIYFDSYRKRNSSIIKNILITFGGSDPQGITVNVLEALKNMKIDVNVRCIVGPSFSPRHVQKIREFQINELLDIYYSPENLSEHYEWADLGICGSGGSRYEAAVTGLPILFTAIYEDHDSLSNIFSSFGTSKYIGVHSKLSSLDWIDAINNLQNFPQSYQKMIDSIERMRQRELGGDWLAKKIEEVFK